MISWKHTTNNHTNQILGVSCQTPVFEHEVFHLHLPIISDARRKQSPYRRTQSSLPPNWPAVSKNTTYCHFNTPPHNIMPKLSMRYLGPDVSLHVLKKYYASYNYVYSIYYIIYIYNRLYIHAYGTSEMKSLRNKVFDLCITLEAPVGLDEIGSLVLADAAGHRYNMIKIHCKFSQTKNLCIYT